ncbi:MAG: 2,3-bisphosphoglycerate-independent phosphoglycerate mutase [Minicystis sp.]
MTASALPRPRPLVLAIADGLGERAERDSNAVRLAATPTLDALAVYPRTLLGASGPDLGLPKGHVGSGLLGLRSLGAGRIPTPDVARIDAVIAERSLHANPVIAQSIQIAKHHFSARLHLFALLSDGGVHSAMNHLTTIIDAAFAEDVPVVVHAFLDSRDAPPKSAAGYLEKLEHFLDRGKKGAIGTVAGRAYAMDNAGRWERTQLAYSAIVRGQAPRVDRWYDAIAKAYDTGKTDDFVEPTRVADYSGMKGSFMCDFNGSDRTWNWFGEENALVVNFRGDRLRQLTSMLLRRNVPPEVEEKMLTDRGRSVTAFIKGTYATLTEHDPSLALPVAFPAAPIDRSFGQVIAEAGLTQLRCGETEKFAHVTSFFSGREAPFTGEDRALIESSDASTAAVAQKAVEAIAAGKHDFILVHLGAADAAAHTGNLDAATRAVESVDAALGAILAAVRDAGGALLVTSTHGNAEQMKDAKGQPHPMHTTNPVPLYYVNEVDRDAKLEPGRLADLAPTMLALLGLPQPEAMTGRALLAR